MTPFELASDFVITVAVAAMGAIAIFATFTKWEEAS